MYSIYENHLNFQWYSTKISIVLLLILPFFNRAIAQNETDFNKYPASYHDSLYFELVKKYYKSDNKRALPYALKSLLLSRKHDHKEIELKSLNAIGVLYKDRDNYDSAIYYYEQALRLGTEINSQERLMYTYCNLGIAYFNLGVFDLSLEYSLESLKLSRRLNNRDVEGDILNNIGLVYSRINDNSQALVYYQECLKVVDKSATIFFRLEGNIGFAYLNLDRYVDAINLFNKILKENPPNELKTDVYYGLASAYLKQSNFVDAKKYLDLALQSVTPNTYSQYIAKSYQIEAEIAYFQNEYPRAIDNLNKGLAFAKKIKSAEVEHDLYLLLSKVYFKKGDYKNSSIAKDHAYALRDSLFNEKFAENFKNIHLKIAKEKSDEIIDSKEATIAKQKLWALGVSIIAGLSLLVVILLWRGTVLMRRSRDALAIANKTIEKQHRELTKFSKALERITDQRTLELLSANDNLAKTQNKLDTLVLRTSFDVNEPLSRLKKICKVALSDLKDHPGALNYFGEVESILNNLQFTFDRLFIIEQIDKAEVLNEKINFHKLIGEILEEEKIRGIPGKVNINVSVEPGIHFQADLTVLRIVLYSLINNAIQYYDPSESVKSLVIIKVYTEKRKLKIEVMDNGVGVNGKRVKLFKAPESFLATGTGLYLTKLACEKLGGTIDFDRSKEGFTQFKATFPLTESMIRPITSLN